MEIYSFENKAEKESKTIKEKFLDFLKYKYLKIKENLGELNLKEFNELLETDFQDYLQDNPPIEKVFSPEKELNKFKLMRKQENRNRKEEKEWLIDFKKKLKKQTEAWAQCQIFIEKNIEFNNDVSKNQLNEIIKRFGDNYGFDDDQKNKLELVVKSYYKKRQQALKLRKDIKNDQKLVKKLTKIDFNEEEMRNIKISVEQMSFVIETNNHNGGKIYDQTNVPIKGFKFSGFASRIKNENENEKDLIVVNNSFLNNFIYYSAVKKEILKHEHHHIKNTLFENIFEKELNNHETDKLSNLYDSCNDLKFKEIIFKRYLFLILTEAFKRVKNELFASLQGESMAMFKYRYLNNLLKNDGNQYDYLYDIKETFKNYSLEERKMADEVLIQEYKKIIKKSLKAFSLLMKKGKYSKRETIALLRDKPFQLWPKAVARFLNS